ncbi:hypothetical protein AMATHDRAFT_58452 [Amanita thiersii Skay4041]|uniref:Enoyl reductase (ER) domain-containing protein n=1 Tax=Amanita thiersii Skay4041 TaxID=703135 RepID=A0A2A9NMB7_9AGAR|nr:hypothetical protein AMATHDRAFT_58452 [Amanita thiersii Skay4041]
MVQMTAAAFNHKDVWIRMGQYPRITFGNTLGADGAGIVVASGNENDSLLNKRVFLAPGRGWINDPDGPESEYGIMGGGPHPPIGSFSEYVIVEKDQVIASPEHLDDVHTAAWPLGGLTAWRAAIVKGGVSKGQNVLITGIGGGVAILALQICVAKGANVYVTSGNEDKMKRATELGAKGGANYREKDWPAKIGALLSKDAKENGCTGLLDVVVDSGGGDIMGQTSKYLKQGGRVVCYGMTASPKISFTMREVLKNQHLLGSTMGSHQDLLDATAFLSAHKIVPVVGHVLDGLENAEEGFDLIRQGSQFGKVVLKFRDHASAPQQRL